MVLLFAKYTGMVATTGSTYRLESTMTARAIDAYGSQVTRKASTITTIMRATCTSTRLVLPVSDTCSLVTWGARIQAQKALFIFFSIQSTETQYVQRLCCSPGGEPIKVASRTPWWWRRAQPNKGERRWSCRTCPQHHGCTSEEHRRFGHPPTQRFPTQTEVECSTQMPTPRKVPLHQQRAWGQQRDAWYSLWCSHVRSWWSLLYLVWNRTAPMG